MQEIQVRALGWEDALEKEMAIHSSTLAWETPWISNQLCPWSSLGGRGLLAYTDLYTPEWACV